MKTGTHFSADYGEARAKFLAACDAANAHVEPYQNPNTDPDGEPLFTDVAAMGPADAERAVLLCSGTHGVEAFAGSAIQTGLLADGIALRLPDGVRLVMIHALNPYGFAHLRRFNEDNIDLNRNFVDHDLPHAENPAYDSLYEAINPSMDSRWAHEWAFLRLVLERVVRGRRTLKVAITEGQYTHPAGLFYGGIAESWSNKTFRTIVDHYLHDAKSVAFVDIHTGLGPHGRGQLICRFPPGSSTYERMFGWWGERVTPAVQFEAATASLRGTITVALSEMLPDADVSPATLEFGTVGPVEILRAMQAENWLHHQGGLDHARADQIKAKMKWIYYPETDDWKECVWRQGKEVVGQALARIFHEAA